MGWGWADGARAGNQKRAGNERRRDASQRREQAGIPSWWTIRAQPRRTERGLPGRGRYGRSAERRDGICGCHASAHGCAGLPGFRAGGAGQWSSWIETERHGGAGMQGQAAGLEAAAAQVAAQGMGRSFQGMGLGMQGGLGMRSEAKRMHGVSDETGGYGFGSASGGFGWGGQGWNYLGQTGMNAQMMQGYEDQMANMRMIQHLQSASMVPVSPPC